MFRLSILILLCATSSLFAVPIEIDICVFGGNASGAVAAIQSARMGKSTVFLEPGNHIGGLTSGGLGATDIGNKAAIGGIAREFYQRLGRHYGTNEMWTFEPSVAERTLRNMLKEANVPVHFQQRLASVKKKGARITEIQMEDGTIFRAKMFIDATYEGDLMAKAKVSYTVGRESNSKYNETLNGIRAQTPSHQFNVDVDPYLKPGNPKSGLLPFIQSESLGTPGQGDKREQAYNFRLCFTQVETNLLPILPPKNYDPKNYELLARFVEARVASGEELKLDKFWLRKMMPNGKTDVNNNGGFSTDAIGMNWDYPEANYDERAKIWQAHEDYTRGFLHFLATSPRVPQNVRDEMNNWGLCKDEFQDTGGWPHQLYVREARRMISDYVMTEHNCRGSKLVADAVSLGAYGMDSHNCQRIVRNGRVENEGDVQVHGFSPYPISYRSIVPKQKECENLFVPVCLSATHIAYGSIRMEPVFMILGQSAATAAALAIDENIPAQKLDYAQLQKRLLADKQILEWSGPKKTLEKRFADPSKMPGIVIDDSAAKRIGSWTGGSASGDQVIGQSYLHDGDSEKGKSSLTFTGQMPKSGNFEIILYAPAAGNRSTNVPATISRNGAELKKVFVNQRTGSGKISLGRFAFFKGDVVDVMVSNAGTRGHVVADAVQFLEIKTADIPSLQPLVKVVENGESKASPDVCRGIIVGPGVNQPDPFPGYGGFVGWDTPIKLKNGTWVAGFNAGYWHASPPTPVHYSPKTLASYRKMGMPEVDAPTGGRAMFTRSFDHGKTWSKPETLIDTPADDRHPAFVELKDGTVLCSFFTYLGEPKDGDLAKDPESAARVWFIRSFDGGKTWEKKPRQIKTPFLYDETDGPLVRLKDGSVLVSINGRGTNGPPDMAGVFRSTDKGKNWKLLGTLQTDHPLVETTVAELHDGRLVFMARPEGDIAWSSDKGRTWTKPVTFGMKMFAPSLYVLRDGTLVCLHGGYAPGFPGLRVIFSRDGGETWSAPAKDHGFLVDNAYGYGKAMELEDGSLFLSYLATGGHRTTDAQQNAIRCIRLRVRADYSGIDLLPAPNR